MNNIKSVYKLHCVYTKKYFYSLTYTYCIRLTTRLVIYLYRGDILFFFRQNLYSVYSSIRDRPNHQIR
jgi:hypothetical protein